MIGSTSANTQRAKKAVQTPKASALAPQSLKYPLTKKAREAVFAVLKPEGISVTKNPGFHEGAIYGEWSLRRLKTLFEELGFTQTGNRNALLFVNEARTVGFQLQGMTPHPDPEKNTWSTYYIEVQVRTAAAAKAESRGTVLFG